MKLTFFKAKFLNNRKMHSVGDMCNCPASIGNQPVVPASKLNVIFVEHFMLIFSTWSL